MWQATGYSKRWRDIGVLTIYLPGVPQYGAEDSAHVEEVQRLLAVTADTYKGLVDLAQQGGTPIPRDGVIPQLPAAACEPGWDDAQVRGRHCCCPARAHLPSLSNTPQGGLLLVLIVLPSTDLA